MARQRVPVAWQRARRCQHRRESSARAASSCSHRGRPSRRAPDFFLPSSRVPGSRKTIPLVPPPVDGSGGPSNAIHSPTAGGTHATRALPRRATLWLPPCDAVLASTARDGGRVSAPAGTRGSDLAVRAVQSSCTPSSTRRSQRWPHGRPAKLLAKRRGICNASGNEHPATGAAPCTLRQQRRGRSYSPVAGRAAARSIPGTERCHCQHLRQRDNSSSSCSCRRDLG